MVDLKHLNYFNNNTKEVLDKFTISEIKHYYRCLVNEYIHTKSDAPIQERFKSNIAFVKAYYPECII